MKSFSPLITVDLELREESRESLGGEADAIWVEALVVAAGWAFLLLTNELAAAVAPFPKPPANEKNFPAAVEDGVGGCAIDACWCTSEAAKKHESSG